MPFHDWNSVGWHVATTCHLCRLFVFLCISGGTYIYVPIYVHTIKICDLLNKVISLIVSDVSLAQFNFLFDGPGMSFVEGIVCPQASQTCCDRNASSSSLVRYMKRIMWSFQILKELVLELGPEHKRLRNKKVDEEKFVLDLSTIDLISGEQYILPAQVITK